MMESGKIQALNYAIRSTIPLIREEADKNPNANVLIRVIRFSDSAQWVCAPTPIANYQWQDLQAEGQTSMGAAFSMIAGELRMPPMSNRGLPPVLVLISDGLPTDQYKKGLNMVMAEPWGRKAVRVAIAIGDDANFSVLEEFISNVEIKPFIARNSQQLIHFIRWASTLVSTVSQSSGTDGRISSNINIPEPSTIPQPSGSGTNIEDMEF